MCGVLCPWNWWNVYACVAAFVPFLTLSITRYFELLRAMSAFGYVIVAPRACDVGCIDPPHTNLPHDPPGFGNFYLQQLKGIDWAKNMTAARDPMFTKINWAGGVGIAGHSMGGQATLFSSSYSNFTQYNIKAAVMHHAYTHTYPAPKVPFIVFTGARDTTAPARPMAEKIYATTQAGKCPAMCIVLCWCGGNTAHLRSQKTRACVLSFAVLVFKLRA